MTKKNYTEPSLKRRLRGVQNTKRSGTTNTSVRKGMSHRISLSSYVMERNRPISIQELQGPQPEKNEDGGTDKF